MHRAVSRAIHCVSFYYRIRRPSVCLGASTRASFITQSSHSDLAEIYVFRALRRRSVSGVELNSRARAGKPLRFSGRLFTPFARPPKSICRHGMLAAAANHRQRFRVYIRRVNDYTRRGGAERTWATSQPARSGVYAAEMPRALPAKRTSTKGLYIGGYIHRQRFYKRSQMLLHSVKPENYRK